uniref:CobW C-terminal domain-containing protein n=1 Tax=Pseudo-nitzschia delicatissima TaxID=44447 RepID=A0A7S0TCK8_9STRA|mmetsp:Transcript_89/g.205  ORF Transcript_89/g.205 Transcript_89/m.205 type:complete len:294 (+) Transcript_89:437-1318(+)
MHFNHGLLSQHHKMCGMRLVTNLYNPKDFDLSKFIQQFEQFQVKEKSCCKAAKAKGESPCCLRARMIDSGKSQVLLPSKKVKNIRHRENYNITSFVYKARRPFLPHPLNDNFIDKFFLSEDNEEEAKEDYEHDDMEEEEKTEPEPKKAKTEEDAKAKLAAIQAMQEEGALKKKIRTETLGKLLRVKGYLWQGNSHDLIGYISTAGNVSHIESHGRWQCLETASYRGTPEHVEAIRKNWVAPYGDRRQELIFIGQDLKHEIIQQLLDDCLFPDEVMAQGPDAWKAIMGDVLLDG